MYGGKNHHTMHTLSTVSIPFIFHGSREQQEKRGFADKEIILGSRFAVSAFIFRDPAFPQKSLKIPLPDTPDFAENQTPK